MAPKFGPMFWRYRLACFAYRYGHSKTNCYAALVLPALIRPRIWLEATALLILLSLLEHRLMNPLNTRFNKAGWSAAANAIVILTNKYGFDGMLDATDQGLIMTIITFLVVLLVPNAEPAN